MADCLYDLNWHELPLNLQRYVAIMMIDMQETIYYHGFEVAILNLNTFLRVGYLIQLTNVIVMPFHFPSFQLIRTVFSYFMIFKTIATK